MDRGRGRGRGRLSFGRGSSLVGVTVSGEDEQSKGGKRRNSTAKESIKRSDVNYQVRRLNQGIQRAELGLDKTGDGGNERY